MYELIILSLLMRFPLHGYLMMKITNDQIGPWARISSGTLSTILSKLEQTGLIAVLPQGSHGASGDRPRQAGGLRWRVSYVRRGRQHFRAAVAPLGRQA